MSYTLIDVLEQALFNLREAEMADRVRTPCSIADTHAELWCSSCPECGYYPEMKKTSQQEGPVVEKNLNAEVDRLSREAQLLAAELGGGWRLEQGVMPVVVLTTVEAERLQSRLHEADQAKRILLTLVEDVQRLYGPTGRTKDAEGYLAAAVDVLRDIRDYESPTASAEEDLEALRDKAASAIMVLRP